MSSSDHLLGIRVESIADHLHFVDAIAQWHWHEWGHGDPGGSLQSWTAGLRERVHRNRIPTTFVALDGDELVGSVTLVEHDMETHREFSPWLAGLYVLPEQRGRDIGSALVRHAMEAAAEMGIRRLYLYTSRARGLYEKLHWHTVGEDYYQGEEVTIMAIDLTTAVAC